VNPGPRAQRSSGLATRPQGQAVHTLVITEFVRSRKQRVVRTGNVLYRISAGSVSKCAAVLHPGTLLSPTNGGDES